MAQVVGRAIRTLSESDIQLLDRRVTDNLSDDEHQKDQGIAVANAPISLAIAVANAPISLAIVHAPEILLTTPVR